MTTHWKHRATRCAVEGCDRTRVKGWSTCALLTHKPLGQSLYGAGKIAPIPAPPRKVVAEYPNGDGGTVKWYDR